MNFSDESRRLNSEISERVEGFLKFVQLYYEIALEIRNSKLEQVARTERFLVLIQKAFEILGLPYTKHNLNRAEWAIKNRRIEEYFLDVDMYIHPDDFKDLQLIADEYLKRRPEGELTDLICLLGFQVTLF